MTSTVIGSVRGLQVLDSRGRPTVEAEVELASGIRARASVPSGASTGSAEAHELRDHIPERYEGRGVLNAVANIGTSLAEVLRGRDALDQRQIDELMVQLDGTPNLQRLGANAVLAVSLATCRAAAEAQQIPLYRWIAELVGNKDVSLPLPMVNILSGGLHARRGMDVQDFLLLPRADSIDEAVHLAVRVRAAADEVAKEYDVTTLLADEGGLSPGFENGRQALGMMLASFERAGLRPGHDAFIALDLAASSLIDEHGQYHFSREGRTYSSAELINLVEVWAAEFPIISVEDPLGEEDWSAWRTLTTRLGRKLQIVGDDLFATNLSRLRRGISEGAANSVLIKLNQNGTLTGTLDVIREARSNRYATIVSARSGETEDSFMVDLAVGTSAGQIKIGSMRGSERLSKYNQLLRIEDQGVPFGGSHQVPAPQ
ncbi:MAG TPA: phosphopyruvate hydratase [Pyrinomonadaceae bacterium]|nr:phosphopyruvate hydratase [Pyrinomonadaceae bacterium]